MFRKRGRANANLVVEPGGSTGSASRAQTHVADAEHALNSGDLDAALEAFTLAIENNPRILRAHLGIGDIYRERGQYDFAEKAYREARRINPRSYDAAYFHGLTLHVLNRIGEAIRAYRRALVLEPNSQEANLNIATAYLQAGQPVEALPFAEAAVRLLEGHGPSHANLGAILSSLNRHDAAVKEFQVAMELMDPSPELIFNLVESLRYAQRYLEMINALDALIRIDPSPAAFERLGFAHFKRRRYGQSIEAYRAAIQLDGDYYPAMNGLAVNLLNRFIQSNRTDTEARSEAVAVLRRSLQIERDQTRILALLGRYDR